MRLLCIAGFLGSGKTTLLLELARRFTEASQTIVIIENEIGEIGVDGNVVGALGLPVREVFGGCVCCTLQTGLVDALREVEERFNPAITIIEPTGLAAPGDIIRATQRRLPHITDARILTLVDVPRWDLLLRAVQPLITAQVEAADVIALNKVDEADEATLSEVEAAVRQFDTAAPLIRVSGTAGVGLDELYEALS